MTLARRSVSIVATVVFALVGTGAQLASADIADIQGDPPSKPDAQRAADAILTKFSPTGYVRFTTYPSSSTGYGTHGGGMAADTWPGIDYKSADVIARGDAFAAFAQANAVALGIYYLVWRDHIWSYARRAEGWRPYTHPSGSVSDTDRHLNHIHVATTDNLGTWRGGPLVGLDAHIVSAKATFVAARTMSSAPDNRYVFEALKTVGLYPWSITNDTWTTGRVSAMRKYESRIYGPTSGKTNGYPDDTTLLSLVKAAGSSLEVVT